MTAIGYIKGCRSITQFKAEASRTIENVPMLISVTIIVPMWNMTDDLFPYQL